MSNNYTDDVLDLAGGHDDDNNNMEEEEKDPMPSEEEEEDEESDSDSSSDNEDSENTATVLASGPVARSPASSTNDDSLTAESSCVSISPFLMLGMILVAYWTYRG